MIKAAKEVKCETCMENRRPAPHRPSSLAKPRHFGDQVHVDLVAVKDLHGASFRITHGIDAVSGYQVAQMMEAKSADEVVRKFHRFPSWGPPRWLLLIAAQSSLRTRCKPAGHARHLSSTTFRWKVHGPKDSPREQAFL